MAWIYGVDQVDSYQSEIGADQRSAPTTSRVKLSKAGWVRLRGCPRHGCRGQAPRDGFTATPATGPTPPSHGLPAFDVDVDSAGAGRSAANKPNPQNIRLIINTTTQV